MKKSVVCTALAISAVVLAGCASSPSPAFKKIDTQAKREITVAKKMHYLWRDTGKILKKAQKKANAGKEKDAMKLASKALDQAKLAQEQARQQAHPVVWY